MSFFKNLKSKLLGSIKEDLNSALGSRRVSFNSKISGALDDLIAMKTGINISNVPQNISEEALLSAEDRKAAEKDLENAAASKGRATPKKTDILRFPTEDNRFVDNWIIFRTVPRNFDGHEGAVPAGGPFANADYGVSVNSNRFGSPVGPIQIQDGTSKEYTIALYFPTGVKDTVSVDYEAKDVGLSDIAINNLLEGQFGDLFGMADDAMSELFAKARQAAIAFSAFEKGVVIDNPKFNTFQGVGFRDHSYSFTLYPYNETDAQEITKIVHAFKMMMLPMTTNADRRTMLMPAEWTIDFQGPILGHIEHPQNCFLKSCDVDYSGGKDMSFIEGFTKSVKGVDDNPDTEVNEKVEPVRAKIQHYPNGINLNLTFQEILNIDRLRYVQRVAANAMGSSQDTQQELDEFEKMIEKQVDELPTDDDPRQSDEAALNEWASKGAPVTNDPKEASDKGLGYRVINGEVIYKGRTVYRPPFGRG